MASYYEAEERALPRNCSADWVAVNKYVDDTLNGSNATLIEQVKLALLKARNISNINDFPGAGASIVLMDPLIYFQVCIFKLVFMNIYLTSD